MHDVTFKIRKARNGWICKAEDEESSEVLAEESDLDDPQDIFAHLLQMIDYTLGPVGSKYSYKRIRVIQLPGTDYMGDMEAEYLEKMRELRDELNSILRRRWKKRK